jgi:hypothetical protein
MGKRIRWQKQMVIIGVSVAGLTIAGAGNAQNLVENGDFTYTTNGPNAFAGYGISDPLDWALATTPVSISSPGCCVAVYAPGDADTMGGRRPGGPVYLWGPGKGADNGLKRTSPDGGNFLASDADPSYSTAILQSISGLTAGQYTLTFDYAAAQFYGFSGETESAWQVTLDGTILTNMTSPVPTPIGCPTLPGAGPCNGGNILLTTPELLIASHGFKGWYTETVTFTLPTGSSPTELLSFLAVGGPGGEPPVALLDSVCLNRGSVANCGAVPEPATWLMMGGGLIALAGLRRLRRLNVSRA